MSEKNKCSSNNLSGEPCRAFAGNSGFCFMHDAARGKERALARRNGGLATKTPHFADASRLPSKVAKIEDVVAILNYTLAETVGLDNSINRGRLLVSIAYGYIEALKVGEFEQRLEAIENVMRLRKQSK